jgi:hypothetical protein
MSGDVEHGYCSVCAKEGHITRTYFRYDVKCECHSPYHFEIVWHCNTCQPEEPKTTQIIINTSELKKLEE